MIEWNCSKRDRRRAEKEESCSHHVMVTFTRSLHPQFACESRRHSAARRRGRDLISRKPEVCAMSLDSSQLSLDALSVAADREETQVVLMS